MALAIKLVKIILSVVCTLCALLALASVISIVTLLVVIGIYIGVSIAADKFIPAFTPAVPDPQPAKRRRHASSQAPSTHKYDTLFGIITGLTPLVLLVLLELTLRLVGYNNSYPLFKDATGAPGYMQVNRDVIKRFLVQPSSASDISASRIYFLKDKPADNYRIIVLGESSAAGFPYGRFGSLTGMLQQRLRRTFPDKRIEVITTAMAAVNTYTLLDFSDEIIAQKPDAVLIYTGHNEYLGILGVGSSYSVSASRKMTLAFLKLRQLRLFQLVKGAYYNIYSVNPPKRTGSDLMADIAKDKEIAYGSPVFEAGVNQFRTNLDAILDSYQQAHIPVLIGTLASNERDQAPFVSQVGPGVDTALWEQTYQQGLTALNQGDLQAATVAFSSDLSMDDTAANAHYAQASVYEKQGNYQEARKFYLAAKDRDQLRFRAPEAFNDVIRQVAQGHGAVVVDVQAALRQEARNGIIGSDLMLEHVHPNARGYFLLTDAYYEALRQHNMIGAWTNPIPKEQAWQEVPLTEVNMLCARYLVEQLTLAYPFKKTATQPNILQPTNLIEQLAYKCYYNSADWLDENHQLLQYYKDRKDTANMIKVASLLADQVPFYPEYQTQAGEVLVDAGKTDQALPYLREAVALNPQDKKALFELAVAYQLAGQTDLARATLAALLRVDPNFQPALDFLKILG